MLTISNRWQKVLKDLSFVDASFTDERAKISAEIETLAKVLLNFYHFIGIIKNIVHVMPH